jgi:hypothetical protein
MGKGTFAFVGGTGKFVGLTGTGEFTRQSLRAPAKSFLQASSFQNPLGSYLKRSEPNCTCFIYGRVRNGSASFFFELKNCISKP